MGRESNDLWAALAKFSRLASISPETPDTSVEALEIERIGRALAECCDFVFVVGLLPLDGLLGLLLTPAILRFAQSRWGFASLFELEYPTTDAVSKKQCLQVVICDPLINHLRHGGASLEHTAEARSSALIKGCGGLSLQRALCLLIRLPSHYKDAAGPSRSQTSACRAYAGSR